MRAALRPATSMSISRLQAIRVRGRGVGQALLTHIIAVASARGYSRLSLETGAMAAFKPAHRLYMRNGFGYCGPFGAYVEDPHSVFMTLTL